MGDTVRRVEYFSIEVPDRPGEAFRVLQAFVSAGINLLVCNAHKIGERARVDVVPDVRPPSAKRPPKPGALAQNLKLLANAGINVAGIDAMGTGGGRWGAILWIEPEDVTRAGRTLGASQS